MIREDATVESLSHLFEQTRERHEQEFDDLGAKVRAEVVVPVCRKYKLTFTSGMGTFFFRKKRTKLSRFDAVEPTYGTREDLDQAVPDGFRGLSASAKEALGPILDLLNKEISHAQHLGYLVADVE